MGKKGGVRKVKKARGVICHVIFDAQGIKTEGLTKNYLEWSVRRWRRSKTTRFIVKACFVLQETVGVLSDPE